VKIDSKLILASRSATTGAILYTYVLTYPRIILPEVNTHRMLSRNTASSRAIPSRKVRQAVLDDPFVPLTIGANQRGMQAGGDLSGWRRLVADKTWEWARYPMVLASWVLEKVGAHKQVVNRIVEPWTYTQQVVTATDLRNVFKLRNHRDAEPHFQVLASRMKEQADWVETWFDVLGWSGSYHDRRLDVNMELKGVGTMQVLQPGEWHLPFLDKSEISPGTWGLAKKISAARCARVSFLLPDTGERSKIGKDVELHDRLSSSGHWSPFEHQATPTEADEYIGNFRAWKQYRKEFPGEDGGDR
jgi:hypothetical protein